MNEFISNFMVLFGVVSIPTGILIKYLKDQSKRDENQLKKDFEQREEQLKSQNQTNTQLERLNQNMEHQVTMINKHMNNNFAIVDDNFLIVNGDLMEIKKVIFNKDRGSQTPLPLRTTDKID